MLAIRSQLDDRARALNSSRSTMRLLAVIRYVELHRWDDVPGKAGLLGTIRPTRFVVLLIQETSRADAVTRTAFRLVIKATNIRDATINRGLFAQVLQVRFRDITDGLSNTAIMSERLIQTTNMNGVAVGPNQVEIILGNAVVEQVHLTPGLCRSTVLGRFYADQTVVFERTGMTWNDGQAQLSSFNTILAPNSPSCLNNGANADQINLVLPPNSRHPGGAMVAFADASVTFISDSIDAGNSAAQLPANEIPMGMSPYGIWGALGSKNGGETVQLP